MICKVAFIGAGYMSEEHIKSFSDISGVELTGIYSRTKSKSEYLFSKYKFSGKCCASIEELYTKSKADFVVISVPELVANEVCIEAFNYPWACLVEKPAGYNYEDALSIAKAAELFKRRVYVALNRRMYSSTRKIIEELTHSIEPRLIHVFDQENPAQALLEGKPDLVVKNWMYANSVHMIDYITLFCRGNIISVEPVIKWNPDEPNFVLSKITFDSGDIGIYEAVWNAPGPWAVTITNHKKRWELRPLEQLTTQLYGSRKAELLETDEWDKEFKPGIRYQAEEAVKAALGKATELTTIANAMKTMQLIKKIYS